ncbi:MAG: hypothetical protein RLZZ54_2630 [Cyanobacteriota bacterium]|jgi:hypothetical protein
MVLMVHMAFSPSMVAEAVTEVQEVMAVLAGMAALEELARQE